MAIHIWKWALSLTCLLLIIRAVMAGMRTSAPGQYRLGAFENAAIIKEE